MTPLPGSTRVCSCVVRIGGAVSGTMAERVESSRGAQRSPSRPSSLGSVRQRRSQLQRPNKQTCTSSTAEQHCKRRQRCNSTQAGAHTGVSAVRRFLSAAIPQTRLPSPSSPKSPLHDLPSRCWPPNLPCALVTLAAISASSSSGAVATICARIKRGRDQPPVAFPAVQSSKAVVVSAAAFTTLTNGGRLTSEPEQSLARATGACARA